MIAGCTVPNLDFSLIQKGHNSDESLMTAWEILSTRHAWNKAREPDRQGVLADAAPTKAPRGDMVGRTATICRIDAEHPFKTMTYPFSCLTLI